MKQNSQKIYTQEFTIDASGKKLGRLACEISTILMGKHKPSFRKNVSGDSMVTIVGSEKLDIHPRKLLGKRYAQYSGYPGGLRYERMEEVIKKKGYGEVIRRAVYGMLPSNKLRKVRMKKLTIKENKE